MFILNILNQLEPTPLINDSSNNVNNTDAYYNYKNYDQLLP